MSSLFRSTLGAQRLQCAGLALFLQAGSLVAAQWDYAWSLDVAPSAEISPMLYGKTWAYNVQIDDAPASIATVAVGFVAQYHFTDAPPGVSGGTLKPFVGDAGVVGAGLGANGRSLNTETLREVMESGWGVANHSYFHRGRTWGKPPEILTEAEIREDLFWSQSLFAHDFGDGRAPSHFIYPNGYLDYKSQFEAFGILAGSAYAAPGGAALYDPKTDFQLLNRAYLDEKRWKESGDPLSMFPITKKIVPGLLQIDFTHGMSADPDSENILRWKKRLGHISETYGAAGEDNLWSAPIGEVIHYALGAQAAEVEATRTGLRVTLPDDAPGTPLTIRLEGIPESVELPTPQDGLLYRDGTTVWITTPLLGQRGVAPPEPAVRSIYHGELGKETFDRPVHLAGIEVAHIGRHKEVTEVEVILTLADGSTTRLPSKPLGPGWKNGKLLFSLVPNAASIPVTAIEVPEKTALRSMRVWTIESPYSP